MRLQEYGPAELGSKGGGKGRKFRVKLSQQKFIEDGPPKYAAPKVELLPQEAKTFDGSQT